MKKFLLIILMFLVSCSNQNSENDEDLLNDGDSDYSDIEEISDYDYSPACLSEWEEVEVSEGLSELFDFEIVKKTGSWSWEKYGDFEKLNSPVNSVPVHIMDDGTMISTCMEDDRGDGNEFLFLICCFQEAVQF